jgi:oxidase EvaA
MFGWTMDADAIRPTSSEHGHFSIIAVHVEAGSREVAEWAQPMIELPHAGFAGLLCAVRDGTMAFLVEGRAEPGHGGAAQVFPTVSSDQSGDARLREQFRRAPEARIRFTAQNAEEGGRFFGCENRLSIVELEPANRVQVPPAYRWLSLGQLCRLGREGRVSMELRNVLACLPVSL